MLYVQLDTNWPDHRKIIRAGLEGAGLHAIALCLAARSDDGSVALDDLRGRGAPDELIQRLVDLGLAHLLEGDRLVPNSLILGGPVGRRWIPTALRETVMERDGHRCLSCGAEDDLSLDHIVPYSHGGPDTEENLRVLCRPCNSRRGNRV